MAPIRTHDNKTHIGQLYESRVEDWGHRVQAIADEDRTFNLHHQRHITTTATSFVSSPSHTPHITGGFLELEWGLCALYSNTKIVLLKFNGKTEWWAPPIPDYTVYIVEWEPGSYTPAETTVGRERRFFAESEAKAAHDQVLGDLMHARLRDTNPPLQLHPDHERLVRAKGQCGLDTLIVALSRGSLHVPDEWPAFRDDMSHRLRVLISRSSLILRPGHACGVMCCDPSGGN
jgi:hypothetical protein